MLLYIMQVALVGIDDNKQFVDLKSSVKDKCKSASFWDLGHCITDRLKVFLCR